MRLPLNQDYLALDIGKALSKVHVHSTAQICQRTDIGEP